MLGKLLNTVYDVVTSLPSISPAQRRKDKEIKQRMARIDTFSAYVKECYKD